MRISSLSNQDLELTQTSCADASTFGFLNFVTRPFGGFCADRIYVRYGVKGKKYFTVALGFLQGAMALALGLVSPPSRREDWLDWALTTLAAVRAPGLPRKEIGRASCRERVS